LIEFESMNLVVWNGLCFCFFNLLFTIACYICEEERKVSWRLKSFWGFNGKLDLENIKSLWIGSKNLLVCNDLCFFFLSFFHLPLFLKMLNHCWRRIKKSNIFFVMGCILEYSRQNCINLINIYYTTII
jgi:hypothetical protein